MTRLKKTYCALSLLFAVVVFAVAVVFFSGAIRVSAADQGNAGSGIGSSEAVIPEDPAGVTDASEPGASEEPAAGEILDPPSDRDTGLSITVNGDRATVSTEVRALLLLTILSLAPSILIMMTSYTRIIIVLHFLRTAIGTQSSPPNQVIVGLSLFLTFFIMWPTFQAVNEDAIQPLDRGEITIEEALEAAQGPIREFMYGETQIKDLHLFMDIDNQEYPEEMTWEDYCDVPFTTVVPAFIISELRQAFIMGFLIYIPFIVIDMVVASVLMSMGMMMLPPTTISLPFKILLFIMADGWNLLIGSLVRTFS